MCCCCGGGLIVVVPSTVLSCSVVRRFLPCRDGSWWMDRGVIGAGENLLFRPDDEAAEDEEANDDAVMWCDAG